MVCMWFVCGNFEVSPYPSVSNLTSADLRLTRALKWVNFATSLGYVTNFTIRGTEFIVWNSST